MRILIAAVVVAVAFAAGWTVVRRVRAPSAQVSDRPAAGAAAPTEDDVRWRARADTKAVGPDPAQTVRLVEPEAPHNAMMLKDPPAWHRGQQELRAAADLVIAAVGDCLRRDPGLDEAVRIDFTWRVRITATDVTATNLVLISVGDGPAVDDMRLDCARAAISGAWTVPLPEGHAIPPAEVDVPFQVVFPP